MLATEMAGAMSLPIHQLETEVDASAQLVEMLPTLENY